MPRWRTCEREPDREIGVALLDQRNLAGLGNIYRTEVLLPARRAADPAGRARWTTCRAWSSSPIA